MCSLSAHSVASTKLSIPHLYSIPRQRATALLLIKAMHNMVGVENIDGES